MLSCRRCGREITEDARFCDQCGAPVMGFSFEQILKPMHIHFRQPDGSLLTFMDVLNSPLPMNQQQMTGDVRSQPWDLDAPYRILWLFYEDLPIADNFSDLILRISSTTPPGRPNDHGHFTVVFFCEGSLEKWICYDKKLIHHYEPQQPDFGKRNHYGIFVDWDLPKKGPCPFPNA